MAYTKAGARAITKEALTEMAATVLDMFEASRQLENAAEAKQMALDKMIQDAGFDECEIVDAAYARPVNQEKIDALLRTQQAPIVS